MMFMRLFFMFVFWLFLVNLVFTQRSSVKGFIVDNDHELVPFATVTLLNNLDSQLYKATTSDIEGYFEFENVLSKQYFLKISFIGFNTYTSNVFTVEENSIFTFDTIRLQKNTQQLLEIEVSAIKPLIEVKPDKVLFNVEGTINASGSDALELLRKAPGITIDNNNNISLKGKSGVIVYIDDKRSILSSEDLATYLQSLNSSQIEHIEIISNPSSKYDAQGNAGIINIRLKKMQKDHANAIINSSYAQGFYPKYDGSITANYKKNSWNVFINYGYNKRITRNFQNIERNLLDVYYIGKSTQRSDRISHNYKSGIDYKINKNHTLGILISGNIMPENIWNNNGTTNIGETLYFPDEVMITDARNISKRNNLSYNANYRYKDSLDRAFTLDLDYNSFLLNELSDNNNLFYTINNKILNNIIHFKNDIYTSIFLYSAKADYEQNILNGRLSIGSKITYTRTNNSFDFLDVYGNTVLLNTNRSNDFSYFENVYAGYAMFQKQVEKLNIQTGIRYEYTYSLGDLISFQNTQDKKVERNYGNFFPTLGLSYEVNSSNSIGLNYSRRINRPDYQSLNPFEYKLDELTYRKGNPFLQPQFSNNIEITYLYKGLITLSTGYTQIQNFNADVLIPFGSNSTIQTTENLQTQKNYYLSPNFSIPIKKWWFLYTNIWMNYTTNEGDLGNGNIVNLSAKYAGFYMQNTFTLPWKINMEVSGWYSSGGIWEGNMKAFPMGAMDVGFQKKILQRKGSIRISFTDLFFTSQWHIESNINGMVVDSKGGWESRQFKINLNYILGSEKAKVQQRKTGLEEDSQRIIKE